MSVELESAIAVIGMSGRFPGAANVEQFWQNLCGGKSSITRLSDEELLAAGVKRETLDDPRYVRAAPVLEGAESFDAAFFGFNPREAEFVNPQHRLFLEQAWTALEDAGHDPRRFDGLVGVYAGGANNAYMLHLYARYGEAIASSLEPIIGNDPDYLATRVSYKLDLKGPSMSVHTACSTSLVALHLACQALLGHECDMALAGGAAVRVPQKQGYLFQEDSILSRDGVCRTFDAKASGAVFGSGVGVVALRRLSDAVRDGDCIRAVILGTALSNDGHDKVGYTAPSVSGQTAVVVEALAAAGVEASTIGYIEAHGTATQIGDPIEVRALTAAFRQTTDRKQYCAIGSVKTNVGHLDAASGITGLIKSVLMLEHRQIPPTVHFTSPNPKIDFESSPFYVARELRDWEGGGPRRAGVSSFGIGGTNAHAILEEAPARPPSPCTRPHQLLLLSARTTSALDTMSAHLAEHVRARNLGGADLADLAYTLQVGRTPMEHRRAVVCADATSAADALSRAANARAVRRGSKPPAVVFMFPGQGAQHVRMGHELYQAEPVYRRVVEECCEALRPYLGFDLREKLFGDDAAVMQQTFIAQPALFVVEYAMARLLVEWGIEPAAMVGHSVGEFVAATLADVFELEEALRLIAKRGRLMQECRPGAMLVVNASEQRVAALLEGSLAIAAVNAPEIVVLAGELQDVDRLEQRLAREGLSGTRLKTSHAFHSAMMDPVLPAFIEEVGRVRLVSPRIPIVSNVTGAWLTAEQATDAAYWGRHMREPVRFSACVETLLAEPNHLFVEVGPGKTGVTLVQQHAAGARRPAISTMRRASQPVAETEVLLRAIGDLWCHGVDVDWALFHREEPRSRVRAPTYAFEPQRFWVDAKLDLGRGGGVVDTAIAEPEAPRRRPPAEWFYAPRWRQAGAAAAAPSRSPSKWLVFDDGELGAPLADQLRAIGHEVLQVAVGERYEHPAVGAFRVRPDSLDDHQALFAELSRRGWVPAHVAHLWSVAPFPRAATPLERARHAQRLGLDSLVCLARVLGSDPVELHVVTANAYGVTGDEPDLCFERRLVAGPCRVIPKDLPNVSCRWVDVDVGADVAGAGAGVVGELLAELLGHASEPLVAHRGGQRWTRAFEPQPLAPEASVRGLRPGGVYVVTGGLGGIGFTLAEHFARTAPVKLALVGRRALPAREDWDAHHLDDATLETIARIRGLERLGAEVMVCTADVCDEVQIKDVIADVAARWGAIHGVVHAAGVPGGGLCQLKDLDEAAAVLAPKVAGTLALDAALAGTELDFFSLCSSLIAVLGSLGQVDYCAANAFLDGFAEHKHRQGAPCVQAINWDAWAEVGMAARARNGGVGAEVSPVRPVSGHPLLDGVRGGERSWSFLSRLGPARHWVLDEHRIHGKATLVGTAYLELALAALARVESNVASNVASNARPLQARLSSVYFVAPLQVDEGKTRETWTILENPAGESHDFRIESRSTDGPPLLHAGGKITVLAAAESPSIDIRAIKSRCRAQEGATLFAGDDAFRFGDRWRECIRELLVGDGEALARLELPERFVPDLDGLTLHPAALDVATAFALAFTDAQAAYLPFAYHAVTVRAPLPRVFYSHARFERPGRGKDQIAQDHLKLDLRLLDPTGRVLVDIEGFTLKRVELAELGRAAPALAATRVPGAGFVDASAIRPDEGAEAFLRAASMATLPQVAISTVDLARRTQAAGSGSGTVNGNGASSGRGQGLAGHSPAYPRPPVHTEYAAPRTELEREVAGLVGEFLGIEGVGVHDDFNELGGHSLLAIQVLAKVNATTGVEVPLEMFLREPTVASLATAIVITLARHAKEPVLVDALAGL